MPFFLNQNILGLCIPYHPIWSFNISVGVTGIRYTLQRHRVYKIDNYHLCASRIQQDDLNTESDVHQDNHKSTPQFALKFCYENYQPSCWYWEITEKLLFTSILPLLTSFSNIFLGLSIILAGFLALLHAYKKNSPRLF